MTTTTRVVQVTKTKGRKKTMKARKPISDLDYNKKREERLNYYKVWHLEHREEQLNYFKVWKLEHPGYMSNYMKIWHLEHPDYNKIWRLENE
jgi:hypothetical protein